MCNFTPSSITGDRRQNIAFCKDAGIQMGASRYINSMFLEKMKAADYDRLTDEQLRELAAEHRESIRRNRGQI